MAYSLFFCGGLVVGLAVAVPIVTLFWIGANKAAQMKAKGELLVAQTTAANLKKKVDASIQKLRSMNPDMTPEQEQQAKDIFISRYQNSPPAYQPIPTGKD